MAIEELELACERYYVTTTASYFGDKKQNVPLFSPDQQLLASSSSRPATYFANAQPHWLLRRPRLGRTASGSCGNYPSFEG